MNKEKTTVPYSDYEKGQLELVDKMIENVYKASTGKVSIWYHRYNFNGEYMLVILKGKNEWVRDNLRFDDFLHYVCDFCDIYFFLKRK